MAGVIAENNSLSILDLGITKLGDEGISELVPAICYSNSLTSVSLCIFFNKV